jgi:hypothetical protein
MKWVILPKQENSPQLYGRIDDDGKMRVTCVAEHPEFVYWLAEGNQPEPWQAEEVN